MTLTERICHWREQAKADVVKWHLNVNRQPAEAVKNFEAGFDSGWHQAIATLRTHNLIKKEG